MEKKKREREKERETKLGELPHLFEMEKSLSLKSHFFSLIPFVFSLLKSNFHLWK